MHLILYSSSRLNLTCTHGCALGSKIESSAPLESSATCAVSARSDQKIGYGLGVGSPHNGAGAPTIHSNTVLTRARHS
eukprot:172561-Pelagomonas_calceolata.AAC.3